MTNQEIVQKMMACKSNKIARNSTVVAAILYLIVGLITIWLGCAARQVGVVNDDSVFAFFELMKESLPKHLFPFVILVVVAITMSTADAYLFTASFIASNNVFSSIIGRNAAKIMDVGVCNLRCGSRTLFNAKNPQRQCPSFNDLNPMDVTRHGDGQAFSV